jgi:hypothetical protein
MHNPKLVELKAAILRKDVFATRRILDEVDPALLDGSVLKLAIATKRPLILEVIAKKTPLPCFDKDILCHGIESKNTKMLACLMKNTDPSVFEQSVLLHAIESKSVAIAQMISQKTAPEHYDRYVLKKAIEGNVSPIFQIVADKTAPSYFDKNLLKQSLKLQNADIVERIVKKTALLHFDKEILHEALRHSSSRTTISVVLKTPQTFFDKESLALSMDKKISQIVHRVAAKTDKNHFDVEILRKSIHTHSEDVVRVIAQNMDAAFFNKEILKLALDTKIPKLISTIASYSKQELFDRDVLELALATKVPDVVRAVVDYTTDRNLFLEYKEAIQKGILRANDVSNLTAQILSRKDNESFDREMQEVVLDIYLNVIKDHCKKSGLPKNFPIKAFESSLLESRYFFSNPEALNFNTLNQSDRFLVVPVYSYGHAFSAVVRKLDEEKYSITFVNLGARPFEKNGHGNQYKEFVYSKEDALKVLKDHSYSLRIHYPARAVTTNQAYKNFALKAKETYTLNVTSRDQKVGNCFLKNIEKGIRYALALGLSKAEDRNFNPGNLRVAIETGGKWKVKFLKPIHKMGAKTNDLTTVELRRDLVNALIKKFPEYQTDIAKEWKFYEKRKERIERKRFDLAAPAIPKTHYAASMYQPTQRFALFGNHHTLTREKRDFLSLDFNRIKKWDSLLSPKDSKRENAKELCLA